MSGWITVDVDLWKHPKMSALPNDSARYGWLVVLCEAKLQHSTGSFSSAVHFKEVMGRFGKFLPVYLHVGLLEEAAGKIVVHDWRKHQWAMTKKRQREDTERTPVGPTHTRTQDTYTDTVSKETTSLRRDSKPTHISELLPRPAFLGGKE